MSISFDELFMKMVYLMASKSKDPSTKVGAVLVRDTRVISTGYNGFPIGVKDSLDRYNQREIKYKFIVHAEHNAILTAARLGINTFDSILYTNGLPCNSCMKSVIQAGIKEIVIHSHWPEMNHSDWKELNLISEIMVKECGINIRQYGEKLGCKGYINKNEIDV